MKAYRINRTVLYFEEIFYIDPVNGLDTNDGLTSQTAFKTLIKYLNLAVENCAAVLLEGIHEVTSVAQILQAQQNYTQSIIGQGLSTKITYTDTPSAAVVKRTKPIHFYRFELYPENTTLTGFKSAALYTDHAAQSLSYWHNIGLRQNGSVPSNYLFVWQPTGGHNLVNVVQFNNCTTKAFGYNTSNQASSLAIIKNSASVINNNTGTLITNLTLSASNIDADYKLLNGAWENAGTGTNPDGTQANIGVYGGEFAWGDWNTGDTLSITGEDENIGIYTNPPIYNYMVDDGMLGSVLNITEKINDVVIRKIYGAERNREYTLEVPIMEFWQLGGNDSAISVTVENGIGEYTRTITFARDIKKVDIKLLPTVTTTRVAKLIPTVNYTGQATSVQILVSNNALDENPTWEEATTATQHIFANSTKTDENWAVAMRVTVEGEEGEHITLSPPSFTYST